MPLNGSKVYSRIQVPLAGINPELIATADEIVAECQSDETVFIKYTSEEIATIGLTPDEFVAQLRDYARQAVPRLTVTGGAAKNGARVRLTLWVDPKNVAAVDSAAAPATTPAG